MPMMPIEPAKAVMTVRPFLVMRLLKESESAVSRLMDERRAGPFAGAPDPSPPRLPSSPRADPRRDASSSGVTGFVSPTMRPSWMRTMRVA